MIDAHLHLWDPTRLDYDWLKHVPAIAGVHDSGHFKNIGIGLEGAVFVQADCAPDQALSEIDWVAGQDFQILGIVAYAPLEAGHGVVPHLAALASRPLVKGVRRNAQNEADGFMTAADYLAGMRLTAEAGLTIDMCIRAPQLPELLEAVRQVPEARIVLDHLGKPDIAAHDANINGDDWADNLSALAALPNVWCKLSGLPTQATWDDWHADELLPYLHHAISTFGPDRCLFGGDWPVVDLAGGYRPWLDVVESAIAGLSGEEQIRIRAGSARDVYRL